MFEGMVALDSCGAMVDWVDWVELGLVEVEAERERSGDESAEEAGDEVEEELVETK